MPTPTELNQLEAAIVQHVIPRKGRKQCVIKFLFAELRMHPKRKTISAKDVLEVCQPKKGTKDKGAGALRRVKADLKKKLDTFFAGKGQALPYRVTFEGEGNYMPVFLPIKVGDFTPLFWGPYLESNHITRLMYPEPFFLTDKFSTTFRNSQVNRLEDKKALAYLDSSRRRKGKDVDSYFESLKPGYSYVPAGIVQAMFVITHCLLRNPGHLTLEAEPIMPLDVWPRNTDELILFATPTSVTELVKSLEGGLRLQTSSEGARVDGAAPIPEPEDGDEFEKMGVVTRIRHLNQTITLISAKHGRAVEAIARELTTSEKLAALAEMLRTPKGFPPEFQALYCVRMKRTPQGPRPDKTTLKKAFTITPRG